MSDTYSNHGDSVLCQILPYIPLTSLQLGRSVYSKELRAAPKLLFVFKRSVKIHLEELLEWGWFFFQPRKTPLLSQSNIYPASFLWKPKIYFQAHYELLFGQILPETKLIYWFR